MAKKLERTRTAKKTLAIGRVAVAGSGIDFDMGDPPDLVMI